MEMQQNNIPVIYYHSVAPVKNPGWFRNYLTLEIKYFEEHLKYFAKSGYKFLFLGEIFDNTKDPDIHQHKKVCLTFDDGYVDNFIYVFPLLKKYKAKATIFVNPDFVVKQNIVRKTLEDYWNNKASLEDINIWGFLSWDEMRLMEQSGLIDIQSHTMSHTKYFVSDKLTGFHQPGAECLYYIGNEFPDSLSYYIGDKEFEKLLPFGYPVFEQKSSIIARKTSISSAFNKAIINSLERQDWKSGYEFNTLFKKIVPIYKEFKKNNFIIESVESNEEYNKRVYNELKNSKDIIERELNKKVEFCCWPHGDNSDFAHKTALNIGYKATSLGKTPIDRLDNTRFYRFGLGSTKNSLWLTRLKTSYKMKSYHKVQPYYLLKNVYEFFRDLA